MRCAWIIDKDYQATAELFRTGRCEDNARGRTGPADAPAELLFALQRGHTTMFKVYVFKLFDELNRLMYRGRLITDQELTEEVRRAALCEFNTTSDVTRVQYLRHPELDVDLKD